MESQNCVEEGVEVTCPTGVEGGCPSLGGNKKLSWTAAEMEEKMASVSRRERQYVLRGSYFSLREMPS